MNQLFQNALKSQTQATPPIWFMRQAGRYHHHYQDLKQKYSFMQLCKEPELAAETAMGPIKDFDFDVSILFSDLLFPLEALGMGLTYNPAPALAWRLNPSNLKDLKPIEEALPKLHFQGEAVKATRQRLPNNKSLIGFVGGPWTLFTYAVEGAHKGNLIAAKTQLGLYKEFAKILVPLLIANIKLQLSNGAEVVMLFDTAAGELSALDFKDTVAPHLNEIAKAYPGQLGYYAKGATHSHFEAVTGFLGRGYDHRWDLADRLKSKHQGFVQGNFDQSLLFMDDLKPALKNYFAPLKELSVEERNGYICGLGHGVLPQTPERNVKLFVDYAREVLR